MPEEIEFGPYTQLLFELSGRHDLCLRTGQEIFEEPVTIQPDLGPLIPEDHSKAKQKINEIVSRVGYVVPQSELRGLNYPNQLRELTDELLRLSITEINERRGLMPEMEPAEFQDAHYAHEADISDVVDAHEPQQNQSRQSQSSDKESSAQSVQSAQDMDTQKRTKLLKRASTIATVTGVLLALALIKNDQNNETVNLSKYTGKPAAALTAKPVKKKCKLEAATRIQGRYDNGRSRIRTTTWLPKDLECGKAYDLVMFMPDSRKGTTMSELEQLTQESMNDKDGINPVIVSTIKWPKRVKYGHREFDMDKHISYLVDTLQSDARAQGVTIRNVIIYSEGNASCRRSPFDYAGQHSAKSKRVKGIILAHPRCIRGRNSYSSSKAIKYILERYAKNGRDFHVVHYRIEKHPSRRLVTRKPQPITNPGPFYKSLVKHPQREIYSGQISGKSQDRSKTAYKAALRHYFHRKK